MRAQLTALTQRNEDERAKREALEKALETASVTVAALRKERASLLVTAREASEKVLALETYVGSTSGDSDQQARAHEATRSQLEHARWQLSQAAARETELRSQLYVEQVSHSDDVAQLEALRSQRHGTVAELRERAKGPAAEAAAATAAAMSLSKASLREAATARSDRSRLEVRVKELERLHAATAAQLRETVDAAAPSRPSTP